MPPAAVRISYRARTDEARAKTKRLRRAIGKDTKAVLKRAADRRIVPDANRSAPGPARGSVVARATTRSVYITTSARGKRRRIVGLLEYGGTVRAHIRPKRARALHWGGGGGGGVFTARVTGPRTYRPKHFMRDAVQRNRRPVLREIERELPKVIRGHLRGVADVDGAGL